MISLHDARSLVESIVAETELPDGDTAVVLEDETITKPWGWVFFYQSRRYLETGDFSSRLAGNSPVIVNARRGMATVTGTARPVEHYIAECERDQRLA